MIKNALIRSARQGDAVKIARIYVDSWRSVYKKILPPSFLRRLNHSSMVQSVHKGLAATENIYLIAEDAHGAPIGYICGGPERSGISIYQSEVYELYLFPVFQRHGIGRQLLSALASKLYQSDFFSLMVWVLASNPNHRFYEKAGGLYLGSKPISFAGQKLHTASYGWADITLALIDETT